MEENNKPNKLKNKEFVYFYDDIYKSNCEILEIDTKKGFDKEGIGNFINKEILNKEMIFLSVEKQLCSLYTDLNFKEGPCCLKKFLISDLFILIEESKHTEYEIFYGNVEGGGGDGEDIPLNNLDYEGNEEEKKVA